MTIFSCLSLEHNLLRTFKQLKCLKNSRNVFFKRHFHSMSKDLRSNKSYISIKIPNNNNVSNGKFTKFFKRDVVNANDKVQKIQKSEWSRLFSLAKPEKWNLMGMVNNRQC